MSSHKNFNPLHGEDDLGGGFETQDLEESSSTPHSSGVELTSHQSAKSSHDATASHDPHHVGLCTLYCL